MRFTENGRKPFYCCLGVMFVCFCLINIFSDFIDDDRELKTFIWTLTLSCIIQYIIFDIILFLLQASYFALRSETNPKTSTIPISADPFMHKRLTYFKLLMAASKSTLALKKKYLNEELNVRYKRIARDLWMYLKYSILLLMIVISRDPLVYYNTRNMSSVFQENIFGNISLNDVVKIQDIYKYITETVIHPFNGAKHYNGENYDEKGWINSQIAKVIGIVRLRQQRFETLNIGLSDPKFSKDNFMPGWKKPFKKPADLETNWRTYRPWMIKEWSGYSNLLASNLHYGQLYAYPESSAYVALLDRNLTVSLQVIEYLQKENWLDRRTAALFMDFTLYNADSNIFTVCSILFEQTLLGSIIAKVVMQSSKLLMSVELFHYSYLVILILYLLQLIQFSKELFLKYWYAENIAKSNWNIVDLVIILLNLITGFVMYIREKYVSDVFREFDMDTETDFVDFRIPAQMDYMVRIILGLLIGVTTMRIWKILLFTRVFRMFSNTLWIARLNLLSLSLAILIFIIAFSLSIYMINGDDSWNFSGFFSSIITSISYAMHNNEKITYELTKDNRLVDIILFTILTLAIIIVLMNIFISTICDYFEMAKKKERNSNLTFFDFLKNEYHWIGKYFKKIHRKMFRSSNKDTIKANISLALDDIEKRVAENRKKRNTTFQDDEDKIKRLLLVAEILLIQMKILSHEILVLQVHFESDDDN